jgi:hypothetical protein
MALGSTQLLTETSARNFPEDKGLPPISLPLSEPIVQKMWEPRLYTTVRSSTASYTDSLTFIAKCHERFWQTAKITNMEKSGNFELSKMTGVQDANDRVRRVGGERRVNTSVNLSVQNEWKTCI